jgi:hypothetical protein
MSEPNHHLDFGSEDIRGLRYIELIRKLLGRLHSQNDHPNRQLHYDEYICFLLLTWFTPVVSSLRGIQRASGFERVQRELGVSRVSLGSLSEAAAVFDPEPLRQIFLELAGQLRAADAQKRPGGLPEDLLVIAADATLWSFLPRMAKFFWKDGPKTGRPPGIKAHVQFEVFKGIPVDAQCSPGYEDERPVIAKQIQAMTLYLFDAGYIDYALFQQIIDLNSSFVVRARSDTAYEVVREAGISPEARAAGVYSDATVKLGSAPHAHKLRQPVRVIKARVRIDPPHNLNPKRAGDRYDPHHRYAPQTMERVLLTNRFDLPAEVIVQLYRYRWQIEIFFRWFKCILGCKHFLSECENGLRLQIYAAMIASLLVTLYMGRKPNKALLEAMQFYFMGWATLDELMATAKGLKPAKA